MVREWLRRFSGSFVARRSDADLEEELRLHLELTAEGGNRDAMRQAGGMLQAMDKLRDQRGLPWLDDLLRDVRYGVRGLRRNPSFAAVAILTLALAIGATTAIFSVMEAVVLRTLPVQDPGDLVYMASGSVERPRLGSNYPYFERVRALTGIFSGTAAYTRNGFKVSTGDAIEVTEGQYLSGNFHAVIGVPIALGRGFTAIDDRTGDGSPIAVISDDYWERKFGRSPDVLGKVLIVDGRPTTIVGVTARGFTGFEPGARLDISLPLSTRELDSPGFLTMHDTWTSMPIIGRLKSGVSRAQAADAVSTVFEQYMSEPENAWMRQGARASSFSKAQVLPAARGAADLRDQYAKALQVLMAMVALVLAVACANVASLLLARGSARAKEVAIRISVGASRMRLIRQFLVEGLLLAIAGGSLGFLLARAGVNAIAAIVAAGQFPILLDVQPNALVLVFTIVVSVVTGLAFGLVPAFATTRVEVAPALKEVSVAGARPRMRRWTSRQVLVAGQIGLCLALVTGAGLLTRTLKNIEGRNGGFDRANLVMFSLDTRGTKFERARIPEFCDAVIDRLTRRFDGASGSCSTSVPINSRGNARALDVPGSPAQSRDLDARLVFMNRISPGYFKTIGISVVAGRPFDQRDTFASAHVAVINQATAKFFFGKDDPVGRTVHYYKDEAHPMTVVGVVSDAAQYNLRQDPLNTFYTPLTQLAEPESNVTVSIRTRRDTAALMASARAEVRALDADIVVDYIRTMEDQIAATLVRERLLALLSGAFGLLALVLSCVGLYGVVSYDAARRSREYGIRVALGARRSDVLRQVLGGAAIVAGSGMIAGLVVAIAGSSLLASFLFGITPRDPLTLAVTAAAIGLTTLLASYLPARRASGADPAVVLRAE